MKRLAIACLAVVPACVGPGPTRPQALVFVDTDAPSPRLVDRLRITLFACGDAAREPLCDACALEVPIEDEGDWPVSFGVAEPPEGEPAPCVHAVLFPVGRTTGARIQPPTAVERVASLRFGEGIVSQEVFLSFACTGIPSEDGLTCDGGELVPVAPARPRDPDAPSRVGTFRAEYDRGCTGSPRPDTGLYDEEVCIPGGTFFMGDIRRQGFGPAFDAVPEHVVTLSPFFLDRYEYSVGRYRAALDAGFDPTGREPTAGRQRTDEDEDEPICTFLGNDEPAHDAWPLTCVSFRLAQALCAWEGKRLPTEAEWEWAAGGRENETLYPWGNALADPERPDRHCGPQPGRASPRPLDTEAVRCDESPEGVRRLSTDVAEWLADLFQPYTGSCWAPGAYGPDPVCDPPLDEPVFGRSVRGGWRGGVAGEVGDYARMVTTRGFAPSIGSYPWVGFRCARDDG